MEGIIFKMTNIIIPNIYVDTKVYKWSRTQNIILIFEGKLLIQQQ